MEKETLVPLYLPGLYEEGKHDDYFLIAGDVGGTKTNLALYRVSRRNLEKIFTETYPSSNFDSVNHILRQFYQDCGCSPEKICLGVAGPVINGKVELTNLSWDLNIEDIRQQLEIEKVALINDLEATAYGLAAMNEDDYLEIHKGNPDLRGNMAILAPGTGLGQAGLYWDGRFHHPFPTEGGHSDFSPRTDFDFDLTRYLQELYEVVSWEKLVSGPAIVDIFNFLKDRKGRKVSPRLLQRLEENDPSAVISRSALEDRDEICMETMDHFVRYLARECSNLVLKMKATGGLFLSGGIPPKIAPLLLQEDFYNHFMQCDRMQHLLEGIPIRIITNQRAPMIGAACYGAWGDWISQV